MEKWKEFEASATNFLNDYFSEFTFENLGESDSTAPDIKVYTKEGKLLTQIEAKYSPSQAGQIVVLIKNNQFEFSTKSKNPKVASTAILIDHLNKNYETYSDVAQSAIPIQIDDSVLFSFIIEQYRLKGNDWIIASSQSLSLCANNLCLIPLSELPQYFEISASLRRKRSGTSSLAKSMREKAEEIISKLFNNYEIKVEGKKTFFHGDIGTHPKELPENLYLSPKGENIYEIRKRSTTNNVNIMFSLKLKENYEFKSEDFLKFLESKVN